MRIHRRAFVVAAFFAVSLAACGGGGGGGNPTPSPTPQPPVGNPNPCSTANLEPEVAREESALDTLQRERKMGRVDASGRWRVLSEIWNHRAAVARRADATQPAEEGDAPVAPAALVEDRGDVAVVVDQGDVVLPRNAFDLRSAGLRFARNGSGGYDVQRIDANFRSPLGNRVTLSDDDTRQVNVPFAFPFYNTPQTAAFVNSDGNITFGDGDSASTDRDVARLLTGAPRVAPFLADLDPSVGGRVFVNATAAAYTVTWCSVPGFGSSLTATLQTSLLPDGTIEMKYENVSLGTAVVGVSPGRTGMFAPVDLSAQGPTGGGAAAVGERFAEERQLDTVTLARSFYRAHPDSYDQLVIWADTHLTTDAFAYEVTIANEIRGIGLDIYDLSRDFGSNGALKSIVFMDVLAKYPGDPEQKVLGENTTLSVLGQESGHRWGAFIDIRDHNGQRSDILLGRDRAHWQFFMDSDASVLEGNDIEDLGGGSFRTRQAVARFSPLDLYNMGVLEASQVPTFFYVENPTNVVPFRSRDDAPMLGVTFNGTRRDVIMPDVVAVNGLRQPPAAQSPRVHRQAFILLVAQANVLNADVDKVDRIRREWEQFFLRATGSRMRAETRLRP